MWVRFFFAVLVAAVLTLQVDKADAQVIGALKTWCGAYYKNQARQKSFPVKRNQCCLKTYTHELGLSHGQLSCTVRERIGVAPFYKVVKGFYQGKLASVCNCRCTKGTECGADGLPKDAATIAKENCRQSCSNSYDRNGGCTRQRDVSACYTARYACMNAC